MARKKKSKISLKPNRGAKKRFKLRGSGSIKFRRAFRNHILTKKSKKMKHQARAAGEVHERDENGVLRMLCEK